MNKYTGRRPIAERFWEKVDKSGDCWLWTAARNGHEYGYGYFMVDTTAGAQRAQVAHRFAWELANGPIPDGMYLCHRCDVPLCVRPDHLFLGTQKDNIADMRAKGRGVYKGAIGERNSHAKLTGADVREIRRRHAAGEGVLRLARAYGVNRETIGRIFRGIRWKNVA